MTSLADKAILSGADNHPPMQEKDMYDSWKSRMELYMLNRQHGRMILESVEDGPLLWPTVEEDGVTRLKKYSKLSPAEAIQADCDHSQGRQRIVGKNSDVNARHVFDLAGEGMQAYTSQAPSSSNLSILYPPNDIQSSINHNVCIASSSIPQMEYALSVHQQSEFSSPETGLVVPVFQKGNDLIDAINHMMSFLTAVVTSSSDTSITPPTAAASLRPKASAKGKQTAKASKAKSLSTLSEVAMTEAQQLKLILKRSMQQTHISQPSGSGTDEGTGDDNKGKDDDGDEEDEGDDGEEGNGDDDDDEDDDREGDDDDDADQEVVRDDDKDDDEVSEDDEHETNEETREEESFDPILQTPKDIEDEGNGDEDLSVNIGEEERHNEEEEEDELYRDININQGRGLPVSLEVKDSHVTLTPAKPDGQQESSSVSS
nr:hypothetical protein [Tanacetum cinerariifolium]